MASDAAADGPAWTALDGHRVLLEVDGGGRQRSFSPVAVELDFQSHLSPRDTFDEHALEVVALDDAGRPRVYDESLAGEDRFRVPHRLDRLFGATKCTLNFVMRDESCRRFAVYFDTIESGRGRLDRYHGLVGDGDKFCHGRHRREIAASHFDQFVDFDSDGDLDLFCGGVEPYVYCHENVGGNRLAPRGRLASGGELFALPASSQRRSWLTVAFYDVDGDGDLDFLSSFNDGPDSGQIVLYRNTTDSRTGTLTFQRVRPLTSTSGESLAGGTKAGGWFPSITLLRDWDGEPTDRLDAIVGANHRLWLYRGAGTHADGSTAFADAEVLAAGGNVIDLVNPRADVADADGDGDLDLVAGSQGGPVWYFENVGTRARPELAAGRIVAFDGKYLIGDAHSGVKVADFDGDGLVDLACGRFWMRADLNRPEAPRDFGGLFHNVGTRTAPRWERSTAGAPFTEEFQPCDAARQNSVRAVDWDGDGRLDLLAGDTDGFVWFFGNIGSRLWPLFDEPQRLRAGGELLSTAGTGGHARLDVCDWNSDGRRDLVVADGQGTVTLFLGVDGATPPALAAGVKLLADGAPIQGGGRASVLVADWDGDGAQDLVFADEKGYWWHRNIAAAGTPVLAARQPIIFAGGDGRRILTRPNLGSFVDWDGDGRRDLIGCAFENSVWKYRDIGTGQPPEFSLRNRSGILIASSPQMISGADAIDWSGDGDLDLLTGQGHGGSGLRFFERDWLEDEMHRTHPTATVIDWQTAPRN